MKESAMDNTIQLDDKAIDDICAKLKNHEETLRKQLADFVSALCDVKVKDMLANNKSAYIMHTRWLYWYAYRYMTNESYRQIAERAKAQGVIYTEQGVNSAVNKMSNLIAANTIWTKRWAILKKMIKSAKEDCNGIGDIIIFAPKELQGKIKVEYK